MDWMNTIVKLAPTVAAALGSPLAGAAVAMLGDIFGISEPTQKSVKEFIENGNLTSDHIFKIKEAELKYQNDEKERGFKYAELAFKDRDSARRFNVAGGVQGKLFILSMLLLSICLGSEVYILFNGYPKGLPEVILGRVLGLLDAVTMLVLTYWYGTTNGSAVKTELLSRADAIK
jgi:hypothetical protein